MSSALYVVILAGSLGLVLFQHWAMPRKGRIVLVSAVLAGFVVVAAVHALASAQSMFAQVMAALAVLFGAQGATAALMLLWREMQADQLEPEAESDKEVA